MINDPYFFGTFYYIAFAGVCGALVFIDFYRCVKIWIVFCKRVNDLLNFSNGTVVELDKQSDAPVDIIVNGQLIARGEVVVIDDNFGVRITEIVNTRSIIGNGE